MDLANLAQLISCHAFASHGNRNLIFWALPVVCAWCTPQRPQRHNSHSANELRSPRLHDEVRDADSAATGRPGRFRWPIGDLPDCEEVSVGWFGPHRRSVSRRGANGAARSLCDDENKSCTGISFQDNLLVVPHYSLTHPPPRLVLPHLVPLELPPGTVSRLLKATRVASPS